MTSRTIQTYLCAWDDDDAQDLAVWLDQRDDLPYAAASLLAVLRYSVRARLYDQLRPVLDLRLDDGPPKGEK